MEKPKTLPALKRWLMKSLLVHKLGREVLSEKDLTPEHIVTQADRELVNKMIRLSREGLIGVGEETLDSPAGQRLLAYQFSYIRGLSVLLYNHRQITQYQRAEPPCYLYFVGPEGTNVVEHTQYARLEEALRTESIIP